jgi:D-3-phosphoglycerate dehydrogenase
MLTRGILSHILSNRVGGVNYLNAPVIAGSMGIKWREIKERVHYYLTSLLVIRLKKGGNESAAYGTLLRENEARLMRMDRIMVDADLTGRILLVHAYDRPGVIGGVASLLGDRGINIGDMHFGREVVGGPSLSLFDVDQPVDDAIVQTILSVAGVIDVKRLDLS